MRKLITSILVVFVIGSLSAQQKKIYIAPDDHTDYMWTNTEEAYSEAFLEMLDYYIHLNDSTANEPYPYQSKWNCDGSFWVYTYQKHRSSEQFDELIRQIKEGKITVPLNTLAGLHGMAPAEATIRQMYYAGSLERKYGLDLDLVLNMEDQVLPLGLSSLWAGSGAKYSWRGICGCATRVRGFSSRPHEIYWYKGLDDQQVLMKWYSLSSENKNLGGYAEARNHELSIVQCKNLMESNKYPYHISGAFGYGWDDLKTLTDEFPTVAKQHTDEHYQVIVSNETDFFEDFDKNYGKDLPSETISYGSTEWGIGVASLAEVSASVKRAIEKLRAAEGLYALVALKDKKFAENLAEMKEKAWIACGLFFEHNWTADGPITRKQRADWQRKMALQLTNYVDSLYSLSQARLGELISNPAKNQETFYVFNPLGWTRTDYCDYFYNGPADIVVVDQVTSQEVPFQFMSKKGEKYIRILANNIPSVGYKVFNIKKGKPKTNPDMAAEVINGVIENDFYKITVTSQGVITSLINKKNNNSECIKQLNNLFANDLGSKGSSPLSDKPLRIENAGPVSVTLVAESYKPIKHTSKITLFKNNDRIELENYITQNFDDKPVTYSFSFNLTNPEIRHEEAGAILTAKPASAGGHYADSICRLDWLAINHFADISGDGNGMILSNRDAYFMKPGNSTVEKLDFSTPQINILAGGQIDKDNGLGIENQDGDSYFENFFAMKPYSNDYNSASSMRFALEHQNPLITGKVTGSKEIYGNQFSLLSISDPNVLLWSVKPAEEGIENGIILRVWNLKNNDVDCTISSELKIEKAKQTTHIETDIEAIITNSGRLNTNIGHNRIETFRLFLK
jgi:alpha-mannosidase